MCVIQHEKKERGGMGKERDGRACVHSMQNASLSLHDKSCRTEALRYDGSFCHHFCFFGVFVPLEIFETYSDVTITGERLQTLTYALHLWPLSH